MHDARVPEARGAVGNPQPALSVQETEDLNAMAEPS